MCIGKDMLLLEDNVKQAWADLQQMPDPHGVGDWEAATAANALPAAIHLLDATPDPMERLGWYAAADVQVLNSGGFTWSDGKEQTAQALPPGIETVEVSSLHGDQVWFFCSWQ